MRIWRVTHRDMRCGNCRAWIATGEKYLEHRIGTARLVRCQPCGESMTGAPAPDVIDEEQSGRPLDVRHQPSLGLEPVGAVAERAWQRRGRR